MALKGGWVIDLDIRSYFDCIEHDHLRAIFTQRVRDGVLIRTLGKWLNAGVLEDGAVSHPDRGTPQGGVVSPLLANLYLHEVLDQWFEHTVKPRLQGRAFLVRYADDAVVVFELEADARRVLRVLPKRFGRYGLELHPDKTRLVPFQRPGAGARPTPPTGGFDFLGFTHYWGRSRKGRQVVRRKTASKRLTAALQRIAKWCRDHRHWKVAEQHRVLCRKLRGYYAYYGITGNNRALADFRHQAGRRWRYWLNRRSWKARMHWTRFSQLLDRYPLPPERVVQSMYRHGAKV